MSAASPDVVPRPGPGALERPRHRLLVISHVLHHRHAGRLWAVEPYVRELELWAGLVGELRLASPCRDGPPPADCKAFDVSNVTMYPMRETGGTTLGAKVAQVAAVPALAWRLLRAMRMADAVHVRCPGNLGLLGALLAPLAGRPRFGKYAGQWSGYRGEAWSYRLQRRVLRSPRWGGPVAVYGPHPTDSQHVVAAISSALSAADVDRARVVARRLAWHAPLRVVYVGRLTASKNVDILLEALALARERGAALSCTIVGDGPMREQLEREAAARIPAGLVRFVGAVPLPRVLDFYETSDISVLVSGTEGWPKAIAEAMTFGLVCIGSDRGLLPELLRDGRGVIVPVRDADALARALAAVAAAPAAYEPMRARAAAWGQAHGAQRVREMLHDSAGQWLAAAGL